jgi:hypothetical protein
MRFLIVRHPKTNSEHTIVQENCVIGKIDPEKCEAKVYIGKSYIDVPPAEILKVKNKASKFNGVGLYWRRILTAHGKKSPGIYWDS